MKHPHPSTDVEVDDFWYLADQWRHASTPEDIETAARALESYLATQHKTHQATLAEVVKAMLTSDKLYGFQIVVTKDLNDKRYIAGFEAGKEFMKDRIKAIAAKYSITLTDDKPPTL